jgi:hypothetical protein
MASELVRSGKAHICFGKYNKQRKNSRANNEHFDKPPLEDSKGASAQRLFSIST